MREGRKMEEEKEEKKRFLRLDDSAAIDLDAGALSDDLSGEHEVLKDGVVHGREGPGCGAGLLEGAGPAGLPQDAALGNKHDVLAAELLLKLTDEPGLDLVESLEEGDGHEDGDGPLSVGNLNLFPQKKKKFQNN